MMLIALILTASPVEVVPVPARVRSSFTLSPKYEKYVDAKGLPIVASAKVPDAALREARSITLSMLSARPELLKALGASKTRLAVMGVTELTTDVPEHSDLTPKEYWDRRARGLGATTVRPAVSCAEENLLEEPGDPYSTESICVHEFAHAVHEMALSRVSADFDAKLQAAFLNAQGKQIWQGTYAMSNEREYWAEAVQSWFDTNRHDDAEHGSIDTREEVQAADPMIAALIVEALGDVAWRYTKPSRRSARDRAQLGRLPDPLPRFAWPEHLKQAVPVRSPPSVDEYVPLLGLELRAPMPRVSPGTHDPSVVMVENAGELELTWDWVDFEGKLVRYATIPAGQTLKQETWLGHVWVVSRGGERLGWFAAPARTSRLVVP